MATLRIAIVCAIAQERDAVLKIFNKHQEGLKKEPFSENRTNDGYLYNALTLDDKDGKELKVLLFTVEIMGGVVTPQRAIEIIQEFKPDFMIMPGVCGGRKGEVNLGDVIVADRVFSLEGKTTTEGSKYDIRTIQVKEQLLGYINSLVGPERNQWNEYVVMESPQMKSFEKDKILSIIFDKDGISFDDFKKEVAQFLSEEEFTQLVWDELHDKEKMIEAKNRTFHLTNEGREYVQGRRDRSLTWPKEPKITVQAHSGPMAISPDGVRSDMTKEKWESISKFQRKVLGVEMEGYGLFSAILRHNENNNLADKPRCEVLLVKGVMDYALNKESDEYKAYAAQTSASWVLEFLLKYAVMSCIRIESALPSNTNMQNVLSSKNKPNDAKPKTLKEIPAEDKQKLVGELAPANTWRYIGLCFEKEYGFVISYDDLVASYGRDTDLILCGHLIDDLGKKGVAIDSFTMALRKNLIGLVTIATKMEEKYLS